MESALMRSRRVDAFEGASNAELKSHKLEGRMAFMFETRFPQRVTAFAAQFSRLGC
jgi:homogentisate 1,2-dioxygenase